MRRVGEATLLSACLKLAAGTLPRLAKSGQSCQGDLDAGQMLPITGTDLHFYHSGASDTLLASQYPVVLVFDMAMLLAFLHHP